MMEVIKKREKRLIGRNKQWIQYISMSVHCCRTCVIGGSSFCASDGRPWAGTSKFS